MMDEEVLEEFRLEAEELLTEAEEVLLKIESAEDFAGEFNKIFRSFHSLKGAAGMFEIDVLQSFMHTIEDQFESTRDQGSMEQAQVDYFLMAVDSARKILAGQEVDFDTTQFGSDAAPSEEATQIREEAQAKADANELPAGSPGLVYVVDDEEFICESLSEILKDYKYEVVSFTDPTETLRACIERAPDLVCTDLKMPQMSGLELLKGIRSKKIECPVVFITGFIDNDLLMEGMESGASGFLEKPFEEHQVIGLVSNAIERLKTWKLLNKSINYILYQFNDLDSYLEQQGKNALRQSLRKELQDLLQLRKALMKSSGN